MIPFIVECDFKSKRLIHVDGAQADNTPVPLDKGISVVDHNGNAIPVEADGLSFYAVTSDNIGDVILFEVTASHAGVPVKGDVELHVTDVAVTLDHLTFVADAPVPK